MDFDKNFPTFKKIYKRINENIINSVYPQTILDYCFRILLFLILCRNIIMGFFLEKILNSNFFDYLFRTFKLDNDALTQFFLLASFVFLIYYYLIIKLCGLFKKINHLNFFSALFIVILTDILYCYSKTITIQLFPFKIVFSNQLEIFLVVLPCFIIFKFFNGLAETIPTPFKQIGYFFSIEFYKDLYKKLKNKNSKTRRE